MSRQRKEFIENMFDKLQYVSVEHPIQRRINLVNKGRHLLGLCPFHNDTRLGSFVVTPDKNIFKCFVCGDEYGGNGIHFVSLYDGLNYLQAAFKVAYEEGIITLDEYQTYSSATYDKKYVENLKKKNETQFIQNRKNEKKAEPQVIHDVYGFMQECAGLSEEHMKHLKDKRALSDERIKADYFTFPNVNKRKLIKALKEWFPEYNDEILSTVPGFYYDKKKQELSYAGYKGIGILIRNMDGKIEAIQIRKDTVKEGEQRYVWFSSSFANYDERYSGGCGTGSPHDVLLPSPTAINKKHCLCITEGRFKSEKLVEFGNYSISVQGVGSWRGIEKTIEQLMRKKEIRKIFIMFDTDMLGNPQVLKQALKLTAVLKKEFSDLIIKISVWHKESGKGIDDVIIAGNLSDVQFKTDIELQDVCTQQLELQLKEWNVEKIRDISIDKLELFKDSLQIACENKLLI